MRALLRQIPAVDAILADDSFEQAKQELGLEHLKEIVQETLTRLRQLILSGEEADVSIEAIRTKVHQQLEQAMEESLRYVINATGTVLHTNLGRAPIAEAVAEAMYKTATRYNNLEYNLLEGHRGSRDDHIVDLLQQLTGAEDALVVNNNAAAVLLMLSALCHEQEVVISRGELVEIGGSFRIPEVISQGGAILHEVGATNKSHIDDYERAINEETSALLRVHTSNYAIIGFTEAPSDEEMVQLAHKHNILAMNDLGSGLFIDLQAFGLPYEPTIQEQIKAGYDIVTFSGDKLLGSGQAGVIVGKKEYIDQMRKHPLMRAFRCDKLTLKTLEMTLRLYLNPEQALETVPILRMISQPLEELKQKAQHIAQQLEDIQPGWKIQVTKGSSQVGGGSFPNGMLPSYLVEIESDTHSASSIEAHLRSNEIPVIIRIHRNKVQIDPRTLFEGEEAVILQALSDLL